MKVTIKELNNRVSRLEILVKVCKIGCLNEQLLEIFNKVYKGVAVVEKQGSFLWFPSKVKVTLAAIGKYRGITFTVVTTKNYNKTLSNGIRTHSDLLLGIQQNRFRKSKMTTAQILYSSKKQS